jgi:hypothetical protein
VGGRRLLSCRALVERGGSGRRELQQNSTIAKLWLLATSCAAVGDSQPTPCSRVEHSRAAPFCVVRVVSCRPQHELDARVRPGVPPRAPGRRQLSPAAAAAAAAAAAVGAAAAGAAAAAAAAVAAAVGRAAALGRQRR